MGKLRANHEEVGTLPLRRLWRTLWRALRCAVWVIIPEYNFGVAPPVGVMDSNALESTVTFPSPSCWKEKWHATSLSPLVQTKYRKLLHGTMTMWDGTVGWKKVVDQFMAWHNRGPTHHHASCLIRGNFFCSIVNFLDIVN